MKNPRLIISVFDPCDFHNILPSSNKDKHTGLLLPWRLRLRAKTCIFRQSVCPSLVTPPSSKCHLWQYCHWSSNHPALKLWITFASFLQIFFSFFLNEEWMNINLLTITCRGTGHYLHYLHHSLASGQTTGREHNPPHQEKIGLKIYWAWPSPSEQDPVSLSVSLSHQEASISLLSFSIRGQTDWKPQSQKTNLSDHIDHSLV